MFGQKHKKKASSSVDWSSCYLLLNLLLFIFSFLVLSRVPFVFDNCHRKGVSEGRRRLVTKFRWIKRSPQQHKTNDLLGERVQRQLIDIENLFI